MALTWIQGPTGSGKTSALQRRYYEWVRGGARTEEILVLTAGARHTSQWRRGLKLEAHGPIEAHSFFGFLQRELNLFWAPVQAAMPELQEWVRPEFLNVEIAHHLMRGMVEPLETEFSRVVKAKPPQIAIQLASNLSTVAASAGLSPGEATRRMALADREEKSPLYETVHGLLEQFRADCLRAGILDYGLALSVFTGVLMHHEPYVEHLRARYRYLLVDDLDESVPAEQDFLAAIAAHMNEAVLSYSTDGGHAAFMGADPDAALAKFRPLAAKVEELAKSQTCSTEMFRFAEALGARIMGQRSNDRFTEVVEERIATDLRGDMVNEVVEKIIALHRRGVPAGEIAIIMPHVDKALEVTAHQALEREAIPLQNLSLSRRLVDEPYARAIITLAGLVHPQWKIPRDSAGSFSNAMQLLLRLDPVRASILGDRIWRDGVLPDLDETGLRRRIGFERSEAYEYLRSWVADASRREWGTDEFAQAVVAEVMAPLVGDLTPARLHAAQQLLMSAHRFRQAMERFGPGSYGSQYIKMLTEGTVAAEPLEAYDVNRNAVTLATPYAYLSTRASSRYQIWVDLSGTGWYANDVKELANPHVLSRHWTDGDRWTDSRNNKLRQRNAARTVRALVRRCTGRLVLAECSMTVWGQEQEGGLSEAFSDLVREKGKAL